MEVQPFVEAATKFESLDIQDLSALSSIFLRAHNELSPNIGALQRSLSNQKNQEVGGGRGLSAAAFHVSP